FRPQPDLGRVREHESCPPQVCGNDERIGHDARDRPDQPHRRTGVAHAMYCPTNRSVDGGTGPPAHSPTLLRKTPASGIESSGLGTPSGSTSVSRNCELSPMRAAVYSIPSGAT